MLRPTNVAFIPSNISEATCRLTGCSLAGPMCHR